VCAERTGPEAEMMGCVETPGYRPLSIAGESWEDGKLFIFLFIFYFFILNMV
jgi:hypothetical protein